MSDIIDVTKVEIAEECRCLCTRSQSELFTVGQEYILFDVEFTYAIRDNKDQYHEVIYEEKAPECDVAEFIYV